jgi:DNA (cytosine-5)-methyltransferase 1
MNEQLKTMHLFAGAGGGLLCDLILGYKPIVAVEWDGYACQVLRERAADGWFPDLHVWEGDVRLFDPSEYKGRVDILHAGFPCQDLSVAGKQSGLGEGTRSGLYREVLRIAGVLRPRFLFLENVAAILSGGLEHVLADLAALGYDCRWTCLRASEVGAPHHRDRWWLRAVRNADNDGQPSADFVEQNTGSNGRNKFGGRGENVADTMRTRLQGQREITGGIEQEQHDAGHDSWWSVESDVGRVAHGMANRTHRIKALGNGQVPLQAAVAWRMLGGE